MLFIASLNSGSNANCYYIGNHEEAVLVDAGLSCRETVKRMQQLALPMEKVKAIFISHEHGDHICGLAALSKKFNLPVYISDGTFNHCNVVLDGGLIHSLKKKLPVLIGRMSILPFAKSHDAAEPMSFLISCGGVNVGVITDIGYACKEVIHHFSQCNAVFLESNYCDTMLTNGNYPYHLQKRISGDRGHLSNTQALELFVRHRSPGLKLLVLSHLSRNNNHPELVEKIFSGHAGNTQIVVASRFEASPVFSITSTSLPIYRGVKRKSSVDQRQLSLF